MRIIIGVTYVRDLEPACEVLQFAVTIRDASGTDVIALHKE